MQSLANNQVQSDIDNVYASLAQVSLKSSETRQKLHSGFSCENPKLLGAIMEHILFHWEDITDVLIDEILTEEVMTLNKLEDTQKKQAPSLASKNLLGKFHDYKSVDLREITGIFDEYNSAAERLAKNI